jgi:hypothetical protein
MLPYFAVISIITLPSLSAYTFPPDIIGSFDEFLRGKFMIDFLDYYSPSLCKEQHEPTGTTPTCTDELYNIATAIKLTQFYTSSNILDNLVGQTLGKEDWNDESKVEGKKYRSMQEFHS